MPGAISRAAPCCCNAARRCSDRVGGWPSTTTLSAGDIPEEERRRFCALWRFAGLETPRSYLEAVQAAGLRLLYHEETSAPAERFYSRLLEAYREHRGEFEAARGLDRYREGLERLEMSQHLAAVGALGQLACIAESPIDG